MKLLHEIINHRLENKKYFEINNQEFKSIWNFYEVYKLCINFLGIKDEKIKYKQKLLCLFITNPDNINLLNKLKENIIKDNIVVEKVLNLLEEEKNEEEYFEDEFYPLNLFGVNIDDRK
jgi:hypothetical protein